MKVTYIGHATCLLEIGGKRILTDPIWANRIFIIKRQQRPGLPLADVLPVDAVLLSHAHFDHFDSATLKQIDKTTPVFCSKNLKALVKRRGFQIIHELAWWQSVESGDLKISSVPTKHFGGRWRPRYNFHQYGGFVVEAGDGSVFFAGDTAYFDGFREIGKRFNISAALLPIGAYQGPPGTNFRQVHMDPAQAIEAFQDLGADYLVPVHFGVFRMAREPIGEPEMWLRKIVKERNMSERVKILKPGEVLAVSKK